MKATARSEGLERQNPGWFMLIRADLPSLLLHMLMTSKTRLGVFSRKDRPCDP